jgi:hypothetical protein
MVSKVSYHMFVDILILVIGLSGAFPTGSTSQSDLPNWAGSELSDSASDSEPNQSTQPLEISSISELNQTEKPSQVPPTDWTRNKGMENPYLYGGDMLGGLGFGKRTFSPTGDNDPVLGILNTAPYYSYWPKGILTWQLHPTAEEARGVVYAAMNEIESKTCVRFNEVEAGSTPATSYIVIIPVDVSCPSTVGMPYRDWYYLALRKWDSRFYIGEAMHKLMHALGFYHEHQRFDRDDYITVIDDNIQAGEYRQFDIIPLDYTKNVGVPYDYQSVMHFGSYAFSSNGSETIVPKQSVVILTDYYTKTGLSSRDVEVIQKSYEGICDNNTVLPRIRTTTTAITQTSTSRMTTTTPTSTSRMTTTTQTNNTTGRTTTVENTFNKPGNPFFSFLRWILSILA